MADCTVNLTGLDKNDLRETPSSVLERGLPEKGNPLELGVTVPSGVLD